MARPACPVILVDGRNYSEIRNQLLAEVSHASFLGFDIETHDRNCHPALKQWRESTHRSGAFDARRTVVTGFSLYPSGFDYAYYVNLNHADVENRLPWELARPFLTSRRDSCPLVVHNVPFEWRMMAAAYQFDLGKTVDTLQLAVSAFDADEYPISRLAELPNWDFKLLIPQIEKQFAGWDGRAELNPAQANLLGKVAGKTSEASWSWNKFAQTISYGYGLKKLVHEFLGGEIGSFNGLLEQFGAKDMGDLTGEQTAKYGGEDSYWAVELMWALLKKIRPSALDAFIKTENPMTHLYGEMAVDGDRVNVDEVKRMEGIELTNQKNLLKVLQDACQGEVQENLNKHAAEQHDPQIAEAIRTSDADLVVQWGFPLQGPDERINEKWYVKGWRRYRAMVGLWQRPDRKPLNPAHYMMVRTIIYDLFGVKLRTYKGKIQSDKNTRGVMLETATGRLRDALTAFTELSGVNQRIGLYIKPYQALTDPETGRVYPVVSSMLATRRMAAEDPNVMQIGKRGIAQYTRGFYGPDESTFLNPWRRKQIKPILLEHPDWTEDQGWAEYLRTHPDFDPRHGVVSIDEKQIELVLVGEASGDREFKAAYGQIPYRDLHSVAAVAVVRAVLKAPNFTLKDFKAMHHGENTLGLKFFNPQGVELEPAPAYKMFRSTEGGKGANFEFWYSGSLSTLGTRWNLSREDANALADEYRAQFPEAVAWREDQVALVSQVGYLDLPDGHRRTKYEATIGWQLTMQDYFSSFGSYAITQFGRKVIGSIQRRAINQVINARIQGTCAPVIKESMLKLRHELMEDLDCRLMFPIHDEIVASVNFDHMLEYMKRLKKIMTTHPKYIHNLVQDGSTSIGVTFQPYNKETAPYGQIEVDEAPADWPWITEPDSKMTDEQFLKTVEYLKTGAEPR